MCLGEIGQLVEIRPEATGIVATRDRTVAVSLVTLDDAVAVGDWVVIHSGFALERLGAEEAAEALALRAGASQPPVLPAPVRAGRSAATAAHRTSWEGSA